MKKRTDISPPTAMPLFPPPLIGKKDSAELHHERVMALGCLAFLLCIVTLLAVFGMYLLHFTIAADTLEANTRLQAAALEVQAGTAPVTTTIDCDFAIDGNVQFDGREVNATNSTVLATYPTTDIQAGMINVPDFTQFRINHIDAHCSGNAQLPAKMLAEAMR